MTIQATPEQIAQFGHISARLRAFLKKKGWTAADLNRALGVRTSTTYDWVCGRAAPNDKIRERLSKVTGIPIDDLKPHLPNGSAREPESLDVKAEPDPSEQWGWRNAEKAAAVPVPIDTLAAISITMTPDGNARLKLDVVIPRARVGEVLQALLNTGLLPKSERSE